MKNRGWILILTFILAVAILPLEIASAQDPTPVSDDQVNQVASQMYCPVCENIPLDVCPTQACAQWRDLIREKLSQGWTSDQIKDYFAAQYGDRVLSVPPVRGLNWLVYILPPVAILLGAWLVVSVIRNSRKRALAQVKTAEVDSTRTDVEYMRKIEEELRNRKA
jgi:cytochrome c-type biogenesis protein CcmH